MYSSSNTGRKKGISGSTLKLIAVASMLIDHIGAAVLERGLLRSPLAASDPLLYDRILRLDDILRLIGRPAFPIFCFRLVEGFLHTRDAKSMPAGSSFSPCCRRSPLIWPSTESSGSHTCRMYILPCSSACW